MRQVERSKSSRGVLCAARLYAGWTPLFLLAFGILSQSLCSFSSFSQNNSLHAQEAAPQKEKKVVELKVFEKKTGVMGTELQIKVYGPDRKLLESAVEAAFAELVRIENLMTTWRDSPLMTINANAGKGWQKAPVEILQIVARSKQIGRISNYAFDVSFFGVGKLWDFKAKPPKIPSAEEIKKAIQLVDARAIQIKPKEKLILLPAGMKIGLGGIAKGYGVDRAMAILREKGIRHAMVNAGGDMKLLGKDHNNSWEIAVKHPRDRDRAMAVLKLSNTCIVTSGDYERFFVHNGKRYHHILDPRTGYPANGCMSATVVAQNAELADAIATSLCVLGPERGLVLVAGLQKVEAIMVDMKGDVHVSAGLKGLVPDHKNKSKSKD